MKKPAVTLRYPKELVRSPQPPAGAVLDESVYVAMRDGIQLAVDVYRPRREGRYPVLLSHSPYIKDIQQQPPQWSHAIESGATTFYLAHGYVHVIAQGRGGGLSQGEWRWFDEKERTDGYDLIEWIAQQPWSNGNVGMIGDSYWSWSHYAAAAAQPPHLKCICLCDGGTDLYRDACYQGGVFNAQFMNQWIPYHTAQFAWPGEVEGKRPPMNLHYVSPVRTPGAAGARQGVRVPDRDAADVLHVPGGASAAAADRERGYPVQQSAAPDRRAAPAVAGGERGASRRRASLAPAAAGHSRCRGDAPGAAGSGGDRMAAGAGKLDAEHRWTSVAGGVTSCPALCRASTS
jgi:X-Pro dipeptidyl-peptidase (S15 family)